MHCPVNIEKILFFIQAFSSYANEHSSISVSIPEIKAKLDSSSGLQSRLPCRQGMKGLMQFKEFDPASQVSNHSHLVCISASNVDEWSYGRIGTSYATLFFQQKSKNSKQAEMSTPMVEDDCTKEAFK